LRKKYSYWRTLPHIQKHDRPLFVTFTTHKRWIVPEGARVLVLDSCLREHCFKINLHAAVVMPDHAHLIFTPLVGADGWTFSLPEIMHSIKGCAARAMNVALNRKGPFGKPSSSTTSYGQMKAWVKRLPTFVRIQFGQV
jgi:REP element-mobilizing transposase RayT